MKNSTIINYELLNNLDLTHPPKNLIGGDMPGDKVQINESHIDKSKKIINALTPLLQQFASINPHKRAVVTVCGGSGVGKSEIATILAGYLRQAEIGAYTLSGDNYPHRIPLYNDAERLRIFNRGGLNGLITSGCYTKKIADVLRSLQIDETDSEPKLISQYPWLKIYQTEGRKALKGYLGTPHEQDYSQLSNIIAQFKNGANVIWLKRMGRSAEDVYYDKIDFSNVNVLIIEWTHGNSDYYFGVDIPILLNSTPQETRQHRLERNRDKKIDSSFTSMVLEIEQQILEGQAHKAKIIVSKSGEILSYQQYRELMTEPEECNE